MTTFLDQTSFVAFDPQTGEITTWGNMSVGAIVHMKLDGHTILEGYGRPATHRVDLNTLTIVEKTAEPSQLNLDLEPSL